MGKTYALTGNDTLTINNRVFKDFADQSIINIEFGNSRVGHTTGKNGNTVFATDKQGENATVTLRLVAGSSDDIFLNGLSVQQGKDLPTFSLMTGTFTKRIGDGNGAVKFINYALLGGVFEQFINTQEQLQGDTEQGIAVYTLWFAQAERAIA